jgi:SAM-dependent methyltransferase
LAGKIVNVSLSSLHQIYAAGDDPWDFASSDYEQRKFAATREALLRPSYRSALELGCGNGALAAHLAPCCDHYLGIDAVEKAVAAARRRVPKAEFACNFYPCRLPDRDYDLIVLSEILYFLSPDSIAQLARDIRELAPRAEIICTTFLGDTEHLLQGAQSVACLQSALRGDFAFQCLADTGIYRIDRGLP